MVVKQEHHSFENGIKTIETYELQDDTLKMVGVTNVNLMNNKELKYDKEAINTTI